MSRTLFAVAGDTRLIAHAGGEITDHQPDGEHHREGQNVLHIRHGERPARGDKEEVKAGDVNHRGEYRRPTPVQQCHYHYAEQIDHHQVGGVKGNQPLAGDNGN
ncbi:hypothetical protein D3C86_1781930 [compost metagenome]